MALIEESYTERSFVVHGPFKQELVDEFKNLGGLWNPNLKRHPFKGWVFSSKKLDEVKKIITDVSNAKPDVSNAKRNGPMRIFSSAVIIGDDQRNFYKHKIHGGKRDEFTPVFFSWDLSTFKYPTSNYFFGLNQMTVNGTKFDIEYSQSKIDFMCKFRNEQMTVTFFTLCDLDNFYGDENAEKIIENFYHHQRLNDQFHPGLNNITECARIFVNYLEALESPEKFVNYGIPSEIRIVMKIWS